MFKYKIDEDTFLRVLDIHHTDEIFYSINRNREYLREYLPWVDATIAIEDSLDFIQMSKEKHVNGNGFDVGIWYKDEFAGTLGFHSMKKFAGEVSIGYWLDERFTGMGMMTKACSAMINYAFDIYGVNRVEIRCAKSNEKSRAIPSRLGFIQEGIIREGERLSHGREDLIIYGLLRREWKG